MVKFSNWDIDFSNGKQGEDLVEGLLKDILTGTIEVKRDMRWIQTGNIYIETECFYNTSGEWEASGLSVTQATHWAFVLENMVIILPTEDLKSIVETEGHSISTAIEPNPTRGFLIKVEHIVRKNRYGTS